MDPPAAPAVDAGAASSAFPAASPGVAPPAPALPVPPVPSLPSPFPAAFEPAALPAAAPAALREDQVQNAVGFLSHPQVRSSTNVASKRSFLERKGLTAAEIDEAFRRVPEAPAAAAAPATPAAPVYAPPPAPAPAQVYAPAAVAAAPGAGPMVLAVAPPPVQPQGVRWSQIVLGVGVVAAAGWAVQALVLPRLRALLDSWSSSRREEEEARNKELTEAVAGLRGCQDELKTTTRALLEAVTLMRDQQRDQQRDVRGGGARGPATGPHDSVYASSSQPPAGRYGGGSGAGYGGMPDKGAYDNGRDSSYLRTEEFAAIRANAGTGYTNSYPPDASYVPPYGNRDGGTSAGPTGGSAYGAVRTAANGPYGGGTGENLPYKVQAPPSPARSTQSVSSRGPASGPGPYGGGPTPGPLGSTTSGSYGTYGGVPGDAVYGQGVSQGPPASPAPPATVTVPAPGPLPSSLPGASPGGRTVPLAPPEQPAYPASFHEVMEMVQQGITPPNVRTDINDAPPDPTRPLSEPRLPPPAKPWERAAANGGAASANGGGASGGGGSSGPSPSPFFAAPAAGGASPFVMATPGSIPWQPLATSVSAPWQPAATTTVSAPANGGGGAGNGPSPSPFTNAPPAVPALTPVSILPPANPAWRPPAPPMRTVAPEAAGGAGSGADGAAGGSISGPAVAAGGTAELPEAAEAAAAAAARVVRAVTAAAEAEAAAQAQGQGPSGGVGAGEGAVEAQ